MLDGMLWLLHRLSSWALTFSVPVCLFHPPACLLVRLFAAEFLVSETPEKLIKQNTKTYVAFIESRHNNSLCPHQPPQLPCGEPLLLVLSVVSGVQRSQQHHRAVREFGWGLQHAGDLPLSLFHSHTLHPLMPSTKVLTVRSSSPYPNVCLPPSPLLSPRVSTLFKNLTLFNPHFSSPLTFPFYHPLLARSELCRAQQMAPIM